MHWVIQLIGFKSPLSLTHSRIAITHVKNKRSKGTKNVLPTQQLRRKQKKSSRFQTPLPVLIKRGENSKWFGESLIELRESSMCWRVHIRPRSFTSLLPYLTYLSSTIVSTMLWPQHPAIAAMMRVWYASFSKATTPLFWVVVLSEWGCCHGWAETHDHHPIFGTLANVW